MKASTKQYLSSYFNSRWLPTLVFLVFLGAFTVTAIPSRQPFFVIANALFIVSALAFLGLIAASVWNLIKKRWSLGIINALLVFGCGVAVVLAFVFLAFASMAGPSEDGFADNLTIPGDIEIFEPEPDPNGWRNESNTEEQDELQGIVRKALTVPGSDESRFTPNMPSLRIAATVQATMFREYIEASPDWHVFVEQGNLFASRSWSSGGEPRHTLHGYISEFDGDSSFQTRCLICLDRKQWSRYSVQHVDEGTDPIEPEMSKGNNLYESRVMIECGSVWVELFEQSGKPERRITKATMSALEKEFSEFEQDPEAALNRARARSRDLADRITGKDGSPFRLLTGIQPGIHQISYSLNPAEPGSTYLKAFEVTKDEPLSTDRLEGASKTRMAWSADPSERFAAKAGFTIYEGDWGKPYAARFEVWFRPDSGEPERKLAERIYKIEGWQR